MESDPPIFETANQTFVASELASSHRVCYVEPAPATDAMFDQLEYLLAHKRKGCPAGCQECMRLGQVEDWLLRPFRAKGKL